MLAALRHQGLTHLHCIHRLYEVETATLKWAWKTKAGNVGFFGMVDTLNPTPEEMTAMFAAIKLTD